MKVAFFSNSHYKAHHRAFGSLSSSTACSVGLSFRLQPYFQIFPHESLLALLDWIAPFCLDQRFQIRVLTPASLHLALSSLDGMAPQAKQRKIAILGARSVGLSAPSMSVRNCASTRKELTLWTGKSSLTVQFCEGHFVDTYYPTIENTFSHEIVYKNQTFLTEIIDTQGQVRRDHRSMFSKRDKQEEC